MKLHLISLLVVASAFTTQVFAQEWNDFYTQMLKADQLVIHQQIDSAIQVYEMAFAKVGYVNSRYLRRVLKLAKQQKDTTRIRQYSKRIEAQLSGTLPSLKIVVDSIFVRDQKVRGGRYSRAYKRYQRCLDDPDCDRTRKKFINARSLAEEQLYTDSANIQTLLQLFQEYGYLGEEQIGASVEKLEILLLHFDKDTNNQILQPVLKIALAEGKIHPIFFAQIQDRHLFYQNKTQIYWTWPCASKAERFTFTEADVPHILQRRESIGIFASNVWQSQKGKWYILKNQLSY